MRRLAMLAVLALLVTAPSVAGDLMHRTWQSVKADWRRANRWPDPYIQPDRELVRSPFATMTDKGWRVENTLSHHHFDTESKLTEAGRLKLESILIITPEQYRIVTVQQGFTPESTATRIAQVQEAAQNIVGPEQPLPEIAQTNKPPHASPADYLESIQRQFQMSTPIPRLSVSAASSGGGSGGGSSN